MVAMLVCGKFFFFPDQCHNELVALTDQSSEHAKNLTVSRYATINAMQACVTSLEQEHRRHVKQMYQRNAYGSEYAPIGEDNITKEFNYPYLVAVVGAENTQHPPQTPPEITRCWPLPGWAGLICFFRPFLCQ